MSCFLKIVECCPTLSHTIVSSLLNKKKSTIHPYHIYGDQKPTELSMELPTLYVMDKNTQ